ncbi:pyridoxamine 5'-phosphate oxidase [Flammeovirgaceae bacterium 311]|nr:pyridoxamine 5'-phosphate oxidase [Flammeovirgaceae bacterium 311]
MNPFLLFQDWYGKELLQSAVSIPSACCLSTIGLDGYPNARFVSLKEVKNDAFIVTGPVNSKKGIEIQQYPKVALTFWWANSERQVRCQGNVVEIADFEADKYFSERSRESQIVSCVSEQGKVMEDLEFLNEKYKEKEFQLQGKVIIRPANWGDFL